MPDFPAQALLRLRPTLADKPVVVVAGDPPLEKVLSLNHQARAAGVAEGITRAELDSFPALTVLRRSLAEERTTRAALLEAAGAFTPRVEIHASATSAFVLALDMAGTTRIFGPAADAVGAMARTFATLRIHARLAASANLNTAICAAPSAHKAHVIIPAGEEQIWLAPLLLAALPLTPVQAETLALWGLRTLGDLAALPEVDLVVRLGQAGKRLRLLARGEFPHLMVPVEPVFTLEEYVAFDGPVELLEQLLYLLAPLLDQLLARAQAHALALASLTVRMGLDGGALHTRTLKPALPVLDRDVLMKLLQLDLEAHPPPAGVVTLHLHAEPGDRSRVQLGLFAPQLPEPLRLDVTLARIAALVGEERVGRARLLDTHRTDRFIMERFTVPSDAIKPRPTSGINARLTGGRVGLQSHHKTAHEEVASAPAMPRQAAALRRCRPPIPISVQQQATTEPALTTQSATALKAQRPAVFFLNGMRYTIQQAYGPWRRSGEWWSTNLWSAEDWDLAATGPTGVKLLCQISHNLLDHNWQLEAMYD